MPFFSLVNLSPRTQAFIVDSYLLFLNGGGWSSINKTKILMRERERERENNLPLVQPYLLVAVDS
jgi:hypothetical protein